MNKSAQPDDAVRPVERHIIRRAALIIRKAWRRQTVDLGESPSPGLVDSTQPAEGRMLKRSSRCGRSQRCGLAGVSALVLLRRADLPASPPER